MEQRPGRYQRLWTRKEACGKASGVPVMGAVTLAVDPAGVCTPAPGSAGERYGARTCWVSDYPAPDGYLAAVAMQGRRPFTVDSRSWRPDDDRMIQESVPRARQR
jgi:4'-phosphopantetheinyl transferase